VIVVTLALSVAALAQNAPRGQQRGGARRVERGAALVRLPVAALDAAVHLTADQRARITAIQEKYRTDVRALRPAPGSPPNPENRAKRAELTRQANQQIEAVLTAAQKERLKSALQEIAPLRGAGLPLELLAQLKLTDEQKKQITAIAREAREKIGALPREERRAKGQEITQAARDKILAVLTADQKATLEKWNSERRRGRRAREDRAQPPGR